MLEMAKDIETSMDDALNAASEEAISETEDLVLMSEEGEENAGEDDGVEIREGVSEDDVDLSATIDAEPEASEQVDDDATVEPGEPEWDGDPKTVPEELKPGYDNMYDTMRKGVDTWMSRKANEWQVERQALQQRLQDLEVNAQQARQAAAAPKEPVRPAEGATQAEVDTYYDERAAYAAYKQNMSMIEQGIIPSAAPAQPAPGAPDPAMERRIQMVQAQDGFTDAIGDQMYALAQSNHHWLSQTTSDDGMMALFDTVKTQIESAAYKDAAAKASTAELQRKASARERKVSKPKATKKPATPARNFADMGLDEALDVAIADGFAESGL